MSHTLKISLIINILFFSAVPTSPIALAADVPFEVVKTYVTAEASDTLGFDGIAVGGVLYDAAAEGEKFGYPPAEGEYDLRVKIPVEAVHYKIEFWNVGEMGGEKGFIFKSSYGKAKLTRTYILGQAYKNVLGKEEYFGGLKSLEKKEVGTPDVDTTFVDELTFTGGPYGKFYYKGQDGAMYQIAHVSNGKEIVFDNVPEETNPKKPRYLMTLGRAMDVRPQITDSSAYGKWMEILNNQELGCSEPGNNLKDSGIRFSDYHGEVMVRPCNDEDAWYGAELDMVLHKDDYIKTGDDSGCVLSLADMTTFVMMPESTLVLSSPSEKESKVRLIWGKIKTNFKRMMKDGTMDVEMSQAVAGIKGTIIVTEETGTESTLKVIEGSVEFTSKATGESEMIEAGEMITATEKGLEKKQEFNIEKEEATWESHEAMIQDSQKQDKSNGSLFLIIIVIIGIIAVILFYFKKQKNKTAEKSPVK